MNNYFTLHHQVAFLKSSLVGCRFQTAFSRFKKTIELQFVYEETVKNLLFYAGINSAIFIQDNQASRKNNTASFFEDLEDLVLEQIHLSEYDRLITFTFEANYRLEFYAFGPKANVFLHKGLELIDQFRIDASPQVIDHLVIGDIALISKQTTIKDKILCREPRFPRQLTPYLEASFAELLSDNISLIKLLDGWVEELKNKPQFRRLSDGSICLLGDLIIPDVESRRYDDVNVMIREAWIQREVRDRFTDKKAKIQDLISASSKRCASILSSLQDDNTSHKRIERYELLGHILMASSHLGNVQSDTVILDNIFEPGSQIAIPVKKGLSFSENAQLYYEKAKGTRKTLMANQERMIDIRKKMDQLGNLSNSFANVDGPKTLERWIKENQSAFGSIIQDQSNKTTASRPWRSIHHLGFEVLIGKSAQGNDELLQVSQKEDIWFHARHVSGSHIIIKMNKRTDYPSVEIIEMVASWAAWHSKAKTAGLAPVIYTKRKFVRKPKGAAPGSVKVDKEQVILVRPQKPDHMTET